jgi:peptide-methionine (S)-S-oxide reductase
MSRARIFAVLVLAAPLAAGVRPRPAAGASGSDPAAGAPGASGSPPAAGASGPALSKATFAAGCFWCAETAFEGLPGVVSVTSGYTGGPEKNPTYEQVSSGRTGHAEAVEVLFDPRRTTYERLLDIFWRNVDPTQKDGQFCDRGRQYRSAIFYHDAEQKRLALESRRRLETGRRRWKGPIVTEIVPATRFTAAEEYHQDFYRKDPVRYRTYRLGCGRDRRLEELWGKPAAQARDH